MIDRFRVVLWVMAVAASGCHEKGQTCCAQTSEARRARESLWNEIRPVALKNCTLKRFGSDNDGGYLMCANLLDGVQSAYSYGIATEDNWGCEMSIKFGVPIHQYDCFTPHRPQCIAGRFDFHDECVGDKAATIDGKPFDTVAHQIAKNGDSSKRLVVKIDVEGAEWDSLLATPDDVLARIDQLPMELHGVDEPRFAELVRKLKRTFYLVSVHFNNWACESTATPMPSWVFQVLFVNKRLGVPDPAHRGRDPGTSPDAPDNTERSDCQPAAPFGTTYPEPQPV
jgi:hypothetical protein